MSSVIQNLLHQSLGDAARSTKFECVINFDNALGSNEDGRSLKYHVKTSQFPGKSNEVIDLKFKGRTIPIKGQVKYDNTWSCTFYLSEDHSTKTLFENWIESLEQVHNFLNAGQRLDDSVEMAKQSNQYTSELQIEQKDFHGEETTSVYILHNAFPKSVSSVDVDYSSTGSILEFTVEFSYSHYSVVSSSQVNTNQIESAVDDIQKTITEKVEEYKGNIGRAVATKIKGAFDMLHDK